MRTCRLQEKPFKEKRNFMKNLFSVPLLAGAFALVVSNSGLVLAETTAHPYSIHPEAVGLSGKPDQKGEQKDRRPAPPKEARQDGKKGEQKDRHSPGEGKQDGKKGEQKGEQKAPIAAEVKQGGKQNAEHKAGHGKQDQKGSGRGHGKQDQKDIRSGHGKQDHKEANQKK
jgi:hypothetical protein